MRNSFDIWGWIKQDLLLLQNEMNFFYGTNMFFTLCFYKKTVFGRKSRLMNLFENILHLKWNFSVGSHEMKFILFDTFGIYWKQAALKFSNIRLLAIDGCKLSEYFVQS